MNSVYTTEVLCKYCGSLLENSVCEYCGQENDVVFFTLVEYREIKRSNLYIPIHPGSILGGIETYMGKQVVIKREDVYV
jgi:hypothetical protein